MRAVFGLLIFFVASLAFSDFTLPSLKTDYEKLVFLLYIKKNVPKLFADAAKHDIDLFTLLENESELVEELKQQPDFDKIFNRKQYLNLTIRPNDNIYIGDVQIDPQAIFSWKDSLGKKVALVQEVFKTPGEFLQTITAHKFLELDPLVLLNKIGVVETKNKKEKARLIKEFKSRNDILIKCKQFNTMAEKYSCILENSEFLVGLPHLPTTEKIKGVIDGILSDNDVLDSFPLGAVLNHLNPYNWHEAKESIEKLKADDLIFFTDNDALTPILTSLLNNETQEANLSKVLGRVNKEFNTYASQTISQRTLATRSVELIEVPPLIGIFRGCVGGDCSSQYSFPYPNDPHERVFFIKSLKKKDQLKGYVSATEVSLTINGKLEKALYIHTISGVNVTAQEAELILRGFEKIKYQFGVNYIVLPISKNIASLINYPSIMGVYKAHINGAEEVDISYQNKNLRLAIQNYSPASGYNRGDYDHIDNNLTGIVLSFEQGNQVDANVSIGGEINNNNHDYPLSKAELSEFILELEASNRSNTVYRILNTLKSKEEFGTQYIKDIQYFSTLIKNKNDRIFNALNKNNNLKTVEAYESLLLGKLKTLGLESSYLDKNPELTIFGRVNCIDAFLEQNLDETVRLALKDTRVSSRTLVIQLLIDNLRTNNKIAAAIARFLEDPDSKVRIAAFIALVNIRPQDKESLDLIFKTSKSDDADIRQDSIGILLLLGRIKSIDKEHLKIILKLLKSENCTLKWAVTNALAKIDPQNPKIAQELARILQDAQDPDFRETVITALVAIKPHDEGTLTILLDSFKSNLVLRREEVRDVLIQIKPQSSKITQELARMLQDKNDYLRKDVSNILVAIKPKDEETIAILLESLGSCNDQIISMLAQTMPKDGPLLDKLLELLKSNELSVRYNAIRLLRIMKLNTPKISAEIAHLVGDQYDNIGVEARSALYEIKPRDSETIKIILGFLSGKNYFRIVERAADVLILIEPQSPEIAQELARMLQDENAYLREVVSKVLIAINPKDEETLNLIFKASKSDDTNIRRDSIGILLSLGHIKPTDEEPLRNILDFLKSENYMLRKKAADALEDAAANTPLKLQNPETAQGLALILQGAQDPDFRKTVFTALVAIKPQDEETIAILLESLKSHVMRQDSWRRTEARDILIQIKPQSSKIAQELALVLRDEKKDNDLREAVSSVLVAIKPKDEETIAILLEDIDSCNDQLISMLAQTMPKDGPLLDKLLGLLKSNEYYVRYKAIQLLRMMKLDTPKISSEIAHLLKDKYDHIRVEAQSTLGEIKPRDNETIKIILGLLSGENNNFKQSAAEVLIQIKPQSPEIVQELARMLQSEKVDDVKKTVSNVLVAIKPQDEEAIAILLEDISSYSNQLVTMLAEILPKNTELRDRLLKHLKSNKWLVRYNALQLLRMMKLVTPEMTSEIAKFVGDKKPDVRYEARITLVENQSIDSESIKIILGFLKSENKFICQSAKNVLIELKLQRLEIKQYLAQMLQDEKDDDVKKTVLDVLEAFLDKNS
ncbi:MAG: HEAT repeat domain-containing protein [Myxococcales bacterium]|nr:MAG: HEAT repeat domain-containing protein [Myxococcales bacterium]